MQSRGRCILILSVLFLLLLRFQPALVFNLITGHQVTENRSGFQFCSEIPVLKFPQHRHLYECNKQTFVENHLTLSFFCR